MGLFTELWKQIQNIGLDVQGANKVALNILKNDQTKSISIRRKRNIASWDMEYLASLLNF